MTNLPPREVKGTKVTLRKSEAGGPARYYLVGSDDKGIFRFGEQKSETAEPEIITPKDYYIRESGHHRHHLGHHRQDGPRGGEY